MSTLYGKEAEKELISSYPAYDMMAEGSQQRANHYGCQAGEDRKERFNVKLIDGAYLWHCYHCGESGYFRPTELVARMHCHKRITPIDSNIWESVYAEGQEDFSRFSLESQLWLSQYGFGEELVGIYGIRYDPQSNCTILPIIVTGEIHGVQLRSHTPHMPKYKTYKSTTEAAAFKNITSKVLFVVEDLLSAYKLHHAGANVVCSMGTNPPTAGALARLGVLDKRLLIWLDNDDAGISGSHKICRELGYTGCMVDNITVGRRQPKETSLVEIKELIKNVV
jgi:hypothetical protein